MTVRAPLDPPFLDRKKIACARLVSGPAGEAVLVRLSTALQQSGPVKMYSSAFRSDGGALALRGNSAA